MDGSGGPRRGDDKHVPILRRLARLGHDRRPFQKGPILPWFIAGGVLLALMALLPLVWTAANAWMERIATVLALFSFLAAVGFWFRMGMRALGVAAVVVVLLYAATAWTSILEVRDIFVLTVLLGFLLFTLAGFNLLFVLEEVVYDLHRLLHLRNPVWAVLPTVIVVGLLVALPWLSEATGLPLGTLRALTPVAAGLLLVAWAVRIAVPRANAALTREVHLIVAGALAGAALADIVGLLAGTGGLLPSLVGYLAILGTWIYISYTTLQRAQYFLRARDVKPWVALMLSASFAVLAHTHAQYNIGGDRALLDLADLRVAYLVLGVWIGLAFFLLRGLWRLLVSLRDERALGGRVRTFAGRLARLAETLLSTERRVGDVTYRVYHRVDRLIPGPPRPPQRPEYPPLDEREGAPVPLSDPRHVLPRWPDDSEE